MCVLACTANLNFAKQIIDGPSVNTPEIKYLFVCRSSAVEILVNYTMLGDVKYLMGIYMYVQLSAICSKEGRP